MASLLTHTQTRRAIELRIPIRRTRGQRDYDAQASCAQIPHAIPTLSTAH